METMENFSIMDFLMAENTINKTILNISAIENPQIEFSRNVERLVSTGEYNYLEAIAEHCEASNIEMEMVPKLLSPELKRKLKIDAARLNLIERGKKKTPRLPI